MGRGGRSGLSGASSEGDIGGGGGERLDCRRLLGFWGIAAAERTLRILLDRYEPLVRSPRRCQGPAAARVGLRCASLGTLALRGGRRELARVGIGNGGSWFSCAPGLGDRVWCDAMPLWIMAALRMPLARELPPAAAVALPLPLPSTRLKLL